MKAAYAGLAFFAIYIFAISNTISNAMISISSALLLLFTIGIYCKEKLSLPLPSATIQIPWWTFLGAVLVASLLVGDGKSIKMAVDYFYLSLPFWLLLAFYYQYPKRGEHAFLIGIAISMLIIGIKSLYVFYYINHMSAARVETFDHNLNGFGTLIAMGLPFMCVMMHCYYRENKGMTIILGLSAILGMAGLILTGSRGALGGFVIGAIALAILKGLMFRQQKQTVPVFAALVICVAVSCAFLHFQGQFSRETDNQRPLFIKSSYSMWKDHPVLGVGLYNWQDAYYSQYKLPQAIEKDIPMPHNTIAYYFSTTGVIGGLGFIIFTLGIFIYLAKNMQKQPDNYLIQAMFWSFIAVTIHGFVDAGLSMRTAFRLCSAYMGVTVASVLFYEKIKLRALAKIKQSITPEQYRKQRYYGQMIGHRNDREDFR